LSSAGPEPPTVAVGSRKGGRRSETDLAAFGGVFWRNDAVGNHQLDLLAGAIA
jgi:hypothetical protein